MLRQQRHRQNNFFLEEFSSNYTTDTEEENFSLLNTNLFVPRIIATLPKLYKSVIGAQVQFSCVTTVLFPVECEWFLNGEFLDPLESDGRFYYKDSRKTLVILSLREEDHGELVMVARNKFGKSTTKCNLTVLDTDFNARNTNKELTHKTKNKNRTKGQRKKQTTIEESAVTLDTNKLSVQGNKNLTMKITNRKDYCNNTESITRDVDTAVGNLSIDADLSVSYNTTPIKPHLIGDNNNKEEEEANISKHNKHEEERDILNKVENSSNSFISRHIPLQKKSSNSWYNETSTIRVIDPLRQKMTLSDF